MISISEPPPAPNIVLIIADDLGFGDLSHYNGGLTRTPVIDQLIAEGTTLTQHYSGSPVCAPARAALLTGRYPQRSGAVDTLETRGLDRVATTETTMADQLSQLGYRTGYVGKWHNGAIDERYHPLNRGFDEFVGFRGGWQDYFDWTIEYQRRPRRSDGRYLTHLWAAEAVDFLRRNAAEPFFLQIAFNAPHGPFQAPTSAIDAVADGDRLTTAVRAIYAMVNEMDRAIGRVMTELAALRLDARTLVLFTSDNGPYLGGEGENDTRRPNEGFNGAKMWVLEGGIRVPMILRWPGVLNQGVTDTTVVHFCDWLPTLCRWAGYNPSLPARLDGVDLGPTLITGAEPQHRYPPRFWQWSRYEPVLGCNSAVRDGDWKLVYPAVEDEMLIAEDADRADDRLIRTSPELFPSIIKRPTATTAAARQARYDVKSVVPMLFHLGEDPGETNDIAAEYPARVAAMSAALSRWFDDVDRDRLVAQQETLQ